MLGPELELLVLEVRQESGLSHQVVRLSAEDFRKIDFLESR